MPRIYLPRFYAPAWLLLKKNGSVVLKVAPHQVARVKKAVTKEKDQDTAYKLELDLLHKRKQLLRTHYDRETWLLSLRLVDCQQVQLEHI